MFDFSKPRVRKDGKVLSKFDLAVELSSVDVNGHWTAVFDVFSYNELRQFLFNRINNLYLLNHERF